MLSVERLTVRFGPHPAVDRVDLRVDDGHVLAVLGPSGSGKSSLLRAVAGLEPLAGGRVRWDDHDLAGVPTHRRGFALMFQDGQLFDHLTVARNVGYALRLGLDRLDRQGRAASRRRVDELLDLVGLAGYGERLPRTLSGGERQRVALARSLAAEPRLLLLDEPLSALDAELRVRLGADLRRILTEAGTTALLVTHDQEEAFAVADRLAVMREGSVVQHGTTEEVWARPADAATALFLGYARILEGDAARAVLAAADRPPAPAIAVRRSALAARRADPLEADPRGLTATVRAVRATPDEVRLVVDADGVGEVDAVGAPGWLPAPGDRVVLRVDPARLAVLPPTATA
ncbi:ABC transporter ATP-binding protein [Nocardioides silvaticus]|uniref:ABC-type quaternary amine transporter n=1 Tax=Nocardioides silvaticus TaxID=2201891 RepID=A0A316TDM2_9ACTN|nr:ABC transporter ATP-binding protein [Nocardioides silvaticus]PWN01888.1 ABC transporter ATP-binding protein [Nocardioides silvaticus]